MIGPRQAQIFSSGAAVSEKMAGTTRLELAHLWRDSEQFISTCNDLQEHGRHRKSLQGSLRHHYCVPPEGNRSYGPSRSFPGKLLRSHLRYFVSDARMSAEGICEHFCATVAMH